MDIPILIILVIIGLLLIAMFKAQRKIGYHTAMLEIVRFLGEENRKISEDYGPLENQTTEQLDRIRGKQEMIQTFLDYFDETDGA